MVAFSDARYTPGASDIGNGRVDLVVSRSEDNGKTWSAPEVMKDKDGKPVAQGDGRMVGGDPNKSRTAGYGDPAVVADRESDDVLVMSVSGFTNFFAARAKHLMLWHAGSPMMAVRLSHHTKTSPTTSTNSLTTPHLVAR